MINGDQVEQHRQLIGYLPQTPNFYDWMTAEEVLDFSLALFHTDKNTRKARIAKTLELVGLTKARKRKVATFSGGMKQRLGIAQAVIHGPSFLILDEPVSALDPIGRRAILDLIESLKTNMTIIFSTHILGDAQEVCNRFCVMKEGHVIDDFYLADKLSSQDNLSMTLDLSEIPKTLLEQLDKLSSVASVSLDGDRMTLTPQANASQWESDVLRVLADANVNFTSITLNQFSLEDYFMSLIGGSHV